MGSMPEVEKEEVTKSPGLAGSLRLGTKRRWRWGIPWAPWARNTRIRYSSQGRSYLSAIGSPARLASTTDNVGARIQFFRGRPKLRSKSRETGRFFGAKAGSKGCKTLAIRSVAVHHNYVQRLGC
ncbi:hypothetical protein CLAIMM_14412 isoform 2 [Cladophialophora immunda]|nr:hypothetical protein CLAIMM_14412 isoform 1 [Cladophialophora immunda]OQV10409.1 hypothetical protein CLAIMM_14412 isoform 2 [Cladophialophora immunda]